MTVDQFLSWFGRWKDIFTTIVAICAIVVVVFQIRQAGQFDKNRIRREQVTARATLPLTLAAISDYAEAMLDSLLPLEAWLERNTLSDAPTYDGPRLDRDTVAAVEKVIAAYPDEHVAKALASIMGHVQVLKSRSRDYGKSEESIRSWSIAMKDNIVMAAEVIARCQDLFDFARDGEDYGEPSKQHIQMVLNLHKAHQHSYPRVWKSAERYSNPAPSIQTDRASRLIPGIFQLGK